MVWYPRSIVYCLFKNSFLNIKTQGNFHQFPTFFLAKAIEKVTGLQLQKVLDEMDYLAPFHSAYRIHTEMALMAFMNNFWGDQYGGRASILALLDLLGLSMPLIMIT